MKAKDLGLRVASVVFLCAALAHIVRLVKGWKTDFGPYSIEPWMSVVAAVVGLALGVWLWKLTCCGKADEVVPPKA
jgi:protein-S-isoprenylcysteine O-methyltransferase Ste14